MGETQNERSKRVKGQEYQINKMRGNNLRKFYRGHADYDEKKRRKRKPINWCRPVQHKSQPGPVVALASFPGSGNTWLRYLLQQVSGIFIVICLICRSVNRRCLQFLTVFVNFHDCSSVNRQFLRLPGVEIFVRHRGF